MVPTAENQKINPRAMMKSIYMSRDESVQSTPGASWFRPQLMVLRSQREEAVLSTCKIDDFVGGSNDLDYWCAKGSECPVCETFGGS